MAGLCAAAKEIQYPNLNQFNCYLYKSLVSSYELEKRSKLPANHSPNYCMYGYT